ncbi:MAG: cell division protein ZapA [Flavobacteriales bacterium]|jgi:cell division protein ZapA (FtsZ GTPase activity inhibitor)
MNEISIKVNIAGRSYPLTISSEQEDAIRKAEQKIEASLETFQKNYAVKDKQDLLAMTALQVATATTPVVETKTVIEKVVERVEVPLDLSSELAQLEALVDQYIQS